MEYVINNGNEWHPAAVPSSSKWYLPLLPKYQETIFSIEKKIGDVGDSSLSGKIDTLESEIKTYIQEKLGVKDAEYDEDGNMKTAAGESITDQIIIG